MAFSHLHVHTQYSLLDGAARIGELVSCAKAMGMDALAITDHGVMYGVIEFYKACKEAGIKPIIGMEAYIAPRSLEDKEGSLDREYAHLILLAKNQTGYRNLMLLASEGFLRGFYYKPRIDYDLLEAHSEGLICLSGCLAGDIPQRILNGNYFDAKQVALRLQHMFGEDFYIEIQNHGLPEQAGVLDGLVRLANDIGAKYVATNDVHYVHKEDAPVQDVLLCIQTNTFVDDENRMRMNAEEFYLKTEGEMQEAFPDYPEAILNTREIADKCDLDIAFGEKHLPGFTAPGGMENLLYLRALAETGLKKKLPGAGQLERDRLYYELYVIENMGFVDYFLIVWDFIDFAKRNDIVVGPGRGSGAGSLVAYCLDITDVDPLKYGLLFERFLNPERISMPDFDIDFCYERRQEVIDYVVEKYGADRVAQIITFGTMAARAAVRDVGRALHMPYGDVDRIAKMVPFELNMTLDKAMSMSDELKKHYENDTAVRKLIDFSRRLEGQPRHASTHAAGVVISRKPVMEVVPLQKNDESVTTQFPMGTLEELGLLKMDFLGLRTLTVIRDTLGFIQQGGKEPPVLDEIPFDDPEVYKLIANAETDGVFQLESAGMRSFMMQLKPDCFEDIIAGIALFRPGPMAQIPRYIASKHGTAKVTYADEKLEHILGTTYGCMVYQEQVMQVVRDIGGFSLGRSDLVRRAMSKKKAKVMELERKNFVYGNEDENVPGAVNNGVPANVANKIFDEMMDFASYAFNKSHAACYAVLSYRTAYLRLYYKPEFMAALINSYIGNLDSVAAYVYASRRMGVRVLPPDVNKSDAKFSVEQGAVRFGLCAVRNVGEAAMKAIVEERMRGGVFKDFFDFCSRAQGLNKRMTEGLIYAGAFDGMGAKRSQLIAVYERVLERTAQERKIRAQGQMSFFDMEGAADALTNASIKLPEIDEYAKTIILDKEREAIGIYISGHPLDDYAPVLDALQYTPLELQEADGSAGPRDNMTVRTGGMLRSCERKPARSGSGIVGYGQLEGTVGMIELVLFPRVLSEMESMFYPTCKVMVSGRLNIREGQTNSILVDKLTPLEAVKPVLYLRFMSLTKEQYNNTLVLLSRFPGNVSVALHDESNKTTKLLPPENSVNLSDVFLKSVKDMLGEENVKLSAR